MPETVEKPDAEALVGSSKHFDAELGRITERKDYLSVAGTRRRWVTPAFILQAKAGESGPARVGFTVSKKVGNAVKRSRAKRRLREIVRLGLPDYASPGWDYVLIGREAAVHYPFERLQKDLAWAVAKLRAGADLKQSSRADAGHETHKLVPHPARKNRS